MDKDEVITLSSDEESDFVVRVDKTPRKPIKKEIVRRSSKVVKCLNNFKKTANNQNVVLINTSKNEPDELIDKDVVDCTKQPVEKNNPQNWESTENSQIHSKPDIIGIDDSSGKKKLSTEGRANKINIDLNESDTEAGTKSVNSEVKEDKSKLGIKNKDEFQNEISKISESTNQNLKFFTEFVEYCGSLEEIASDRAKLTKKLMKRYGEADCHYIKSEDFRSLIQKFRDNVTKHNLYIIAKEVTDELMYRKKIENGTGKTEEVCQRNQETVDNFNKVSKNERKRNKKQTKVIKIITKLDKLGLKIRELEEIEVDFSDEEESAYVRLQRYRERFYQIYTKLCKFTNDLSDLDRIYNRKICFTESKYPEINKCIEKWLNKTKRFPDFSDVMKLLESQSSSLALPSNKEAIRAIAIEIFQQVGSMLQRKRKYDLWDSLSGYLNDGEDPASKDVILEEVFRKNFEIRVKKEQEIFQHYAELQEKQRLEPEEVPDEEANHSPNESGNEDEEEIESTDELLNERLDIPAGEEIEGNGNTIGKNCSDKEKDDSEDEPTEQTPKEEYTQSKESKNNYKNCKSLRWRTENGSKTKSESVSSEDSNAEQESEKEREVEDSENELIKEESDEPNSWKGSEEDSDLELIAVKNFKSVSMGGIYGKIKEEAKSLFESPLKRSLASEDEEPVPKRMRTVCDEDDELEIFEIEDENDNPERKKKEIIDVHCCQIFADNVFTELDERKKDWGKRKVFRDLTNLNRLMELHGKRRKISGLFSSSFFYRNFCEFDKSSWKKKFKISFRSVGSWDQKCALNQDEKSGKTMNSDSGGDSDEKDIQNNSEGRGDDEGNNFFSGQGNGSEGDNNEDENKKSGRTDIELNETQREEEDEEEEDESNAESTEHSLPHQKTEEQVNNTPSELADKSVEEEPNEKPYTSSETPNKENNEAGEESNLEVENKEEAPEVIDENRSVNSEKEDNKVTSKEAVEVEESKPSEELETEKKNNEVTEVKKPSEDVEVTAETKPPNQLDEVEDANKLTASKNAYKYENIRANSSTKTTESHKTRTNALPKGLESVKAETTKHAHATNKPTTTWKSTPIDSSPQRLRKRTASSTSDEEIVKRFLLHSPSSISITPPRKLTISKSPSQAALQALATLRNLKGISATIVRGKPKDETIRGSYSRRSDQGNQNLAKRGRSDFPVVSNVQNVTPKIVNVSGNVSGFDNSWPGISNTTCDSSHIRISNVWGSLPNNFMQSMVDETITPGCSSQKSNPGPSNTVKKKNAKKTVEYVVLD